MKLTAIGCMAMLLILTTIACRNSFIHYWSPGESALASGAINDRIDATVKKVYACLVKPAVNLNLADFNSGDAYQGNRSYSPAKFQAFRENKISDCREGLRLANEAIQLSNAADRDDPWHKERLAEMHFLRGHFGFELKKLTDTAEAGEASWLQIEADFKYGTSLLPVGVANQPNQPGRYAAWAYLCKAYIYQKKWSQASAAADEVIKSRHYKLMPDLADVFNIKNDKNQELVFAILYEGSDEATLKTDTDDGYLVASLNLVNYYKTDDLGLPLRNHDGLRAEDLVDPRLGFTLAKKELLHQGNNIVIRYADLLLWKAEAAIELGEFETGRRLINIVRCRVKESERIQKRAVASATSLKIEAYTTLFDCYECAIEAVKDERRLELALEGHRFYDLQRWGAK